MDDGTEPRTTPEPSAVHGTDVDDHQVIHEGVTMALYIAVSLFVGHGVLAPAARRSLGVQALAAAGIGAIAALPLLFARGPTALSISRLLLAGVIGLFAYGVSIQTQPSRLRAAVYAVVVVAIALTVAIAKNLLAGH